MIAHTELESFEDLVPIIKNIANSGNERFFQMDVKPDYGDTPENWLAFKIFQACLQLLFVSINIFPIIAIKNILVFV
jgi:hypothetical protein